MQNGIIWRRRQRRQEELEMMLVRRRNLRSLRDASNPFSVPASVFTGKYRLSQDLVLALVDEIKGFLSGGNKCFAIPAEIKVLAALHFFAHGSDQKSCAGEHDVSMSQPSLSRCIQELTEALNQPVVLRKWIEFPGRDNRRQLLTRHYVQFGLPGILGYVDGTHVNIRAPHNQEEIYVNRKSQHSLNVQIACDLNLRIINILARYPGSSHDSFIWRNCALREKMQELNENGEECWLLGDSGYPSECWLLTPILNAEEGTPEANYTARHIKARNCVERCIGVLKGRFRCILKMRVLEYGPEKAGKIVNACAVLHNMCILAHTPLPDDIYAEADEDAHLNTIPITTNSAELERALQVRTTVIRRMAL